MLTRWTRIGELHGTDAEQAWAWFVDRYRAFVRGILAGVLRRSDVVAEAEAEFWGYAYLSNAFQRADRARRFRAFLSGIVRNFALSFARKRNLPGLDPDAVSALAASDREQDRVTRLWVDNVIANALATLRAESPTTANAIALFYGIDAEGHSRAPLTAAQVAERLGNTLQAIYMLLFRGRRRLRELVVDELREGCDDAEALRDEVQMLLGVAARSLPGLVDDPSGQAAS